MQACNCIERIDEQLYPYDSRLFVFIMDCCLEGYAKCSEVVSCHE